MCICFPLPLCVSRIAKFYSSSGFYFHINIIKFLALYSQLTIQSHYTSLRFVMEEWNCSCVSTRIPKHELDSQAFGNSSEKELNLVSSETAFLFSTTSPKMLCLIADHNVMGVTQNQRAQRGQDVCFLPLPLRYFFFLSPLPSSNFEIQGHSPIR